MQKTKANSPVFGQFIPFIRLGSLHIEAAKKRMDKNKKAHLNKKRADKIDAWRNRLEMQSSVLALRFLHGFPTKQCLI